jgi:hypothetical protein
MKIALTSMITIVLLMGCVAPAPTPAPDYMPEPAGIQRDRASANSAPVTPPPETVGLGSVQMIKVGDSQQSVLEKLGSPNIVTSSDQGGELWVYDKISVSREAQVGLTSANSVAAVAQSSSRTMMTTVYFDSGDKVIDIKYRSSRY